MLIATLPPVYREELLHSIISHPSVGGVRYNIGMVSPFTPEETLRMLRTITGQHAKKLWIDLKGRQLRIVHWAVPDYGKIIINHEIEIDGDACAYFRGGSKHIVKFAHGNVIYLDPPPARAVGDGQSLNIIGDNVVIHGYLTDTDKEYIQAARKLGISSFMLSFVECDRDIAEVTSEYFRTPPAADNAELDLVLKIESPAGMRFVRTNEVAAGKHHRLMAARDDLFTTIGEDKSKIIPYLKRIINRDADAIVASRLFSGIERDGTLALSDITDIEYLRHLGYKHFMLSDEICHGHFETAIEAWIGLKH